MTPEQCNRDILTPALALLPSGMDTRWARVNLLAIGLQESRLIHRKQIGGPAKGLWQFESGGGVKGVKTHSATKTHARAVCDERGVPFQQKAIYDALEHDDILAACFARLNLWWAPGALPHSATEGWAYYLNTWRPGKPHPATWFGFWQQAVQAVPQ